MQILPEPYNHVKHIKTEEMLSECVCDLAGFRFVEFIQKSSKSIDDNMENYSFSHNDK